MKRHITLSMDGIVYAKTKERFGNVSAYVEAILRQAINRPATEGENKEEGLNVLKEKVATLEAERAEANLKLRKYQEKEARRKSKSTWH